MEDKLKKHDKYIFAPYTISFKATFKKKKLI